MEDYLIKIPAAYSGDPALREYMNINSVVAYDQKEYSAWLFSGLFRAICKIIDLEEYGFNVPYKLIKQKTGETIFAS